MNKDSTLFLLTSVLYSYFLQVEYLFVVSNHNRHDRDRHHQFLELLHYGTIWYTSWTHGNTFGTLGLASRGALC